MPTSSQALVVTLLLAGCAEATFQSINKPPDASITSHGDGDTVLEGAITLAAVVTDDGDEAAIKTLWQIDGVPAVCVGGSASVVADGQLLLSCTAELDPGLYQVSVVATDADGSSTTAGIGLQVVASAAPTVKINLPQVDGVYFIDEAVPLDGEVSDDEDHPNQLQVRWQTDPPVFAAEVPVVPSNGHVVGSAVGLTPGRYQMQLWATDSRGNATVEAVNIEVREPNVAPTCEIVSPADGTELPLNGLLRAVALVDDQDDGPSALAIEWSTGVTTLGTDQANAAGVAELNTTDLPVGPHYVTIEVTDPFGLSCSDVVQLYVTNTPPILQSVSLTPTAPTAADTLVCAAGAVTDVNEPPGSPAFSVRYGWARNGVRLAQFGSTLSGQFSPGDTIQCFGTPSDGTADGAEVASNTVTILPPCPTINTVSFTPATVYTNTVVTAQVSVSGFVGPAPLSYVWFVQDAGGTRAVGANSATLTSDAYVKGDYVQVTVTPQGGAHCLNIAQTAGFVVANTRPTAPTVAISPYPGPFNPNAIPFAGVDSLQCALLTPSTDLDGDMVTYTTDWTVRETPTSPVLPFYGSTDSGASAIPNDLVDAAIPVLGETWTCTVTPTDGEQGPSASDSVVMDGCDPGAEEACAEESCKALYELGVVTDGIYWIDPDGAAAVFEPFEVQCDMTLAGGGWTLVMVAATDGFNYWTYGNRSLWTEDQEYGSLGSSLRDYKSLAMNRVNFRDLLFVHSGGVWASYDSVFPTGYQQAPGFGAFGPFVAGQGLENRLATTDGISVSAHHPAFGPRDHLCGDRLYFNVYDDYHNFRDEFYSHSYGPTWWVDADTPPNCGIEIEDPGADSSLGPRADSVATEDSALGFAEALGLNTGAVQYSMRVYVR